MLGLKAFRQNRSRSELLPTCMSPITRILRAFCLIPSVRKETSAICACVVSVCTSRLVQPTVLRKQKLHARSHPWNACHFSRFRNRKKNGKGRGQRKSKKKG